MSIPRHDELIIDAIELHMLMSPTFVDPFWQDSLLDTGEVGRVEHPDLDPLRTKFGN